MSQFFIDWWQTIVVFLIAAIVVIFITWRGYWPAIWSATRNLWNAPDRILRHVVVVILVVLTLTLLKANVQRIAEQKASEWLTSYNGTATTDIVGPINATVPGLLTNSASPTPPPTPLPLASPTSTASPIATPEAGPKASATATPLPKPTPTEAEQKRMDAQLRSIRDRNKHHGDVMAFFYVNFFVAIVLVMFAALLAAVTLFFIAQGGWSGTNSYVRAIFVVASAAAAFYGLFPPVFQQQKNITDNKQLFLEYKSLENEVESYPVTRSTLKNELKTPAEFINHIDAEMDRLGNIALGFDITKINYEEAINLGKRPSPSPTPTPTPARAPARAPARR